MEGLIATLLVVTLMGGALIVLARGWPRSSRLGGYRARTARGSAGSPAREQEQGVAMREDDDARWQWDRPDDPSSPP